MEFFTMIRQIITAKQTTFFVIYLLLVSTNFTKDGLFH